MLQDIGFSPAVAEAFAPWAARDAVPGRVARVDDGVVHVLTGAGVQRLGLGGGLLGELAAHPRARPCPGDWVVVRRWPDRRCTLEAVLPRRTTVCRPASHGVPGEVLCANADVVAAVVTPRTLPGDVERLLRVATGGGARPLLVLTGPQGDVRPHAVGVVDARTAEGVAHLRVLAADGSTLALVGITAHRRLTEVLVGAEVLPRGATGRGLVLLPGGGAVIDTSPLHEWRGSRGRGLLGDAR